MKREEFLKACVVGLTSCAACTTAASEAVAAADTSQENVALDRARTRYAALVEIIARHVPADTQRTIFRELGRECARQFKAMTYEKYPGNLAGFLAAASGPNGWMQSAHYDEKSGVISVVDRTCTCPLVKKGLTPGLQCECTLGWHEETYSKMLGRPVNATIVESVLRGGQQCVFRVETR